MDFEINGRRALVLGRTKGLSWSTAHGLGTSRGDCGYTGRDKAAAVLRAGELSPAGFGFGLDLAKAGERLPDLDFPPYCDVI
jgi:NAD(P)-dependent dehydrogenase (short-subunit alcohol dehydrogenase family)